MSHVQALSKMMSDGALPIGLGCSRLGSVNGASGPEALAILQAALDDGIRFFDTSNIYAQGDSERLLSQVLGGRDDVIVCSKAGKFLSWKKRALVPLKGLLRGVARRSDQARKGLASARAKPMPTRWDPAFLTASIDASLGRLKRERLEMFMLHSPDAEVVRRGEAVGALAAAAQAGKIGIVGVSVDDVACAEACLQDPRVGAIQVPLHPGDTAFDAILAEARGKGVAVIAREILGGTAAISGASDPRTYAAERIAEVILRPEVTLTLVGTTRLTNLAASVAAVHAATEPSA